jgi:predicted nucleic acid-binding protein
MFASLLGNQLLGHIAGLDARAGAEAGRLMARRKLEGRDYHPRDAMIAAIALTHHATMATRNMKHFEDLPLTLVNPWQA